MAVQSIEADPLTSSSTSPNVAACVSDPEEVTRLSDASVKQELLKMRSFGVQTEPQEIPTPMILESWSQSPNGKYNCIMTPSKPFSDEKRTQPKYITQAVLGSATKCQNLCGVSQELFGQTLEQINETSGFLLKKNILPEDQLTLFLGK